MNRTHEKHGQSQGQEDLEERFKFAVYSLHIGSANNGQSILRQDMGFACFPGGSGSLFPLDRDR
jgi:hypothetical protein